MAYDATDFQPATVDPLTITEPKERLKYLADFLRGLPDEKFDMRNFSGLKVQAAANGSLGYTYIHRTRLKRDCGTCACIGGWANAVFARRGKIDNDERAGDLLGLDVDRRSDLFWPDRGNWGDITPAQAADVLDHLRLTGEVDWSVARSPVSAS